MKRSQNHSTFSEWTMHTLRCRLRVPVTVLMLGCNMAWTLQSHGEVLIKTNRGVTVSFLAPQGVLPVAGYNNNAAPTASDLLLFRNDITGASNFRVSNVANANLSVQGIKLVNPGGAITIQNNDSQNQTLTIGTGGIDLSQATQNLTISNTSTTNSVTVALTSAQAATWSVAQGRTLQVASVITGSSGLTINPGINGLGGIVLLGGTNSAGNTYTGATTVNDSTLQLEYTTAANRIHSGSALNLNRGLLNLQGTAAQAQAVTGLNLGAGFNQITRSVGTATLNVGTITRNSPAALLNVGTAGVVTTTNANVNGILGGWAVVNNTDWATGGGVINALAAGSYTPISSAWSGTTNASNASITGTSIGAVTGAANTLRFLHGTATTAMTLTLTGPLNLTAGGILRNQAATTLITGGSLTAGGTADAAADSLYIWNAQSTMTVASNIVNNGADVVNVVKAGASELVLSGAASTYTGTTTVANGRLTINNPNAINKAGDILLYGNSGGDNTGSFQWNTTAATLTGNITGAAGTDALRHTFRKLTSSVLTLAPTSANTYSGSTLIEAGSLRAGNATAFSPNSRYQLSNVANAVLDLGGFNNTVRGLAGGGSIGGNVTLGSFNLTLQSLPNDLLTYSGVISGTGGLIKNGEGTQILSVNQTFTGAVNVTAGTLDTQSLAATSVTVGAGAILNSGNLNAATSVTVNGDGLLQLKTSSTLGTPAVSLNGNGATLQLANGVTQSFPVYASATGSRLLLTAGAADTNVIFSETGTDIINGVISMSSNQGLGKGNVTKTGAGILDLAGGNGYNGSTTIDAGTLRVAAGATLEVLPDTTSVILNNTGAPVLNLNGKNETIGSLSGGAGGGQVILGLGTLTLGGDGSATTFSGAISGTGGLVKTGAGALTLDGTNTFTGGVSILGGSLILDKTGGNALATSVPVTLKGTGSRLLINSSQTLGALNAGPNTSVEINTGTTLTTAQGGGTVSILAHGDTDTRIIRLSDENGAANLRPGMTVSGANIPAGAYITQILTGNQILINLPVTANFSNTGLNFGTVGEIAGGLNGGGNWTKTGSGVTVLSGSNSLSGTINVAEGTLQVGGVNTNARNWLNGIINDQASVVLGNAAKLDFASNLLSATGFERIGSLSGGGTTASISLTGLGSSTSTILAVGGNDTTTKTYTGNIVGGTASGLIKEGSGTLIWENNNATSMAGLIRVESGNLTLRGTEGANSGARLSVSNKTGAVLSIATTGGEMVAGLSGGGRGAATSFANGTLGALGGNFLGSSGGEVALSNGISLTLENPTLNAIMRYGGAITGAGSLVKSGANTLELYGDSTYTGVTEIRAINTDARTNTLRLGAYGTSSGVGTLPSSGFGSLPASTRLALVSSSGNGRNVIFDLNGATQTLSSLVASFEGGVRTVQMRAGTININTGEGDVSGTFNGNFEGLGTINVLGTRGTDGWNLTGDSNVTQSGTLNIQGGIVSLNRSLGTLGDKVHVKVGAGAQLSVRESDVIGSLSGAGAVSLAATRSLTLSAAPAGGAIDNPWTGTISGQGQLVLNAGASLRLTTAQSYSGGTTVNSGSALYLDYGNGATAVPLIPSALNLQGGSIFVSGTGNAGQTTLATVTRVASGSTTIASQLGSTAMLNLGQINRLSGGVLQIRGGSMSTTTAASHGILGGYATYHAADPETGVPIVSWAKPNSGGAAVANFTGFTTDGSYGSGKHTDVTPANAIEAIAGSIGSLRFNTPAGLDLLIGGDGNEQTLIQSGGILVTPAVGPNTITIRGLEPDATLTGGQGGDWLVSDELIIHQHNTRAPLIIDAVIADFASNLGLTKTGQGTLVLTRSNAYNGPTRILGGVLELASSEEVLGDQGNLGLGTSDVLNHGYLVFNRTDSQPYFFDNSITGTGTVRKTGSSTVRLRGSGSYSGPTQILGGTLAVTTVTGLGSVDGLTSIAPSSTLQLEGMTSAETVLLKGGTLAAAVSGAGLTGSVTVTADSTLRSASSSAPLTLSGPVLVAPGKKLTIGGANGGTVILASAQNTLGDITVSPNTVLQIGNVSAGSVGRGLITNNGTVISNTNNTNLVIGAQITGSGNFVQTRNNVNVFLTADNSYTGTTAVGAGAGSGSQVMLHVGNDTYTGSLGTGAVTVQASTVGETSLRYHLLRNAVVNNNIALNPFTDGTSLRHAYFLRQGIGSITLAGTITAGIHDSGPETQRAILQSEGGGKLVLRGTLDNSATRSQNIVNNGTIVFDGSNAQEIWGVMSGGGAYVFRNDNTIALRGQNTFNGSNYIQRGTVVINNAVGGLNDDADMYVLNTGTLKFETSDLVGAFYGLKGGTLSLVNGSTLTLDDNVTSSSYATITGDGTLKLGATSGAAWYGLFGVNDLTSDAYIGSSSSQQVTVRVNSLPDGNQASSLGSGTALVMGVPGSSGEARLEYIGPGESTNRAINMDGAANAHVRIAGSGKSGLVLNGPITITNAGNKTLFLAGQSAGNILNGTLTDGASVLSLNVNSSATTNSDMYGTGRWTLTNANSDFSGGITVNLGFLELAGDLGNGAGATSVLGDLTVTRSVDLGAANFDGRRFDVYSGGDNLGAQGATAANSGTILFNDPNPGTAVFDKLNFTQTFTGTANIGSGELVNNGTKVLEFKGTFTTTSTENAARSWTLDGTNTGTNTISGVISDTPNGSSTTSVLKEGTGTWKLSGVNTYQGVTQVARGILEISGGQAIFDDGILNVSNAGSDFSSVGGAVLRILTSEVVGGIQGGIGGVIDIAAGQILTTRNANQTFNGIISGEGGVTRTNNDGNGRVTTMTAKSTYTGPTTITTNGTNLVGNRIDVLFLANGGSASGIGQASSAASNLILNTGAAGSGSGGGGLRWVGTGTQSTDRLFTLGAGSAAAGIWADGLVLGDFAPTISFTGTDAIAYVTPNTVQTLTLRGGTISENRFNPQLTNNGTGATTLSKVEGGMWIIGGNNTYTGGTSVTGGTLAAASNTAFGASTGTVTVNGGGGVGVQLRNGVTISNPLSNLAGDGGLASFSGDNTWAGNISLANGNWRVGADAGASLNLAGTVSGLGTGVRLIKYGQGTLTLSGTMSHTGITSIAGGTVVLNYDTAAGGSVSSKLADGSVLELGWTGGTSGITTGLGAESDVGGQSAQYAFSGGTLILSGGAAGAHTEIVSSTTINAGANRILRQGAATTILQMGAITRNTGTGATDYGTLDLGAAGIATTTTLNTTGGNILAPNSAAITVNRTDWATTSSTAGTNAINAYTAYNNNGFGTNQNTNITNAVTTLASATLAHTIRFDTNTGGTTINLGTNTLSLETGGILVTKNNTDNIILNGGTLNRSANTANLDTVIHHHGTGTLTINSVIANNTNLQSLTKTGEGLVVLNGVNTYTGRVTLQQGVLQVGDGTAGTVNARLASGNNTIGMSDGTTLRINVANDALEYTPSTITGGGLLHLASSNKSIFTLSVDNSNWIGDILIQGGTLRVRSNANALGNVRGITTIDNTGRLDINGVSQTFAERITMREGSTVSATANGATNTNSTISGPMTLQNTTSAGAAFDIASGQLLTLSSMIRASKGFTKTGAGTLILSGNHMQDFLDGAILGSGTPNTNSALLGQIVVSNGDLRLGGTRALGATGAGNETIVTGTGSLDLRGQSLNYGDDPDLFREIIRVEGAGFNGTGALKNTSNLGVFSALEIVAGSTTTLSSGGYANSSRLVLAPYDINPNTGSTLAGNFTRMEATIAGNNANLIIIGSSTNNDANGAGVTFRDPKFLSALNSIYVKEGMFRIEKEAGSNATFNGLTSGNVTNGITVGYGGASIGEQSNGSLALGPNVGARLNFYRNLDTVHSVNITLDGSIAKLNGGYNFIDMGADATAPNPRTYLSGQITLLGDADRNIFHIDAVGATALSVGEQGNMTGAIQAKLIINGQMVGSGGFTKTGVRELRLTANNTFTGDVNILRFGAAAMAWQDNVANFNGINYQTYGDAEGWAEAGVVLAGNNGTLAGTQNINLQRRGLLTLDNTNRLDQTSLVSGGNNNNRINDAANILFNHGWLRIIGGTVNNNESLATAGGAKVQVLSGSNILDLLPTDGANAAMTLTIGEITRAPGSVLYINNLDSTSTFSSNNGPESVRVILNSLGTLDAVGAANTPTSNKVIVGLFGGIMPHQYLSDMRQLGYNNSGNSDYLAQGRNQQFITATHFMTWDSANNILRPLDDSEYFIPEDGLIDSLNGAAGQNVSLNGPITVVRENVSINALRFGALADNNGSGGTINNTTTMTGLIDAHNLQLYVDGTLKIESGMLSSGYFTVGNGSVSTVVVGGTLDFGAREAIINNQNAIINSTAGTVSTGNLEIRSTIAGTAGLLKTGLAQVVLDGRNTYAGVTTISNGTLFLRNGRQSLGAGGAGNGVVVEGNGNLNSGNGIQVGTAAAPENILVKVMQGNQYAFRVDNDQTNFFGNITIDNVDAAGQVLFTPLVRLDNAASAIMNGNITGGATAVSNDVLAIDSRVIQFEGAGNNVFNFRGQFGDRADVNGNPLPIANPISTLPTSNVAGSLRTNENEVLRVNLNGATETNFIMDRQYNAAGRLTTIQGTVMINYDPADTSRDGDGFWTNAAISKIPNADSTSTAFTLNGSTTQQGFVLGTTANGSSALFLTKPGQVFNMASWNATGSGLKWAGGMNETGTVTFGSSTATGSLSISSATLRLYSMAGGTVVFDQRMTGNAGSAPNIIGFAKVGRGTVILENSTLNSASDSSFEIGGGKLLLDHDGQNVARVGANNAIFNGGVVQARSNPNANSTVNYGITAAANNLLQIRNGTTEVIAEGVGTRTMTVNMGHNNANNNAANVTRAAGGTLNLVEWVNGTGAGVITLNMNNFTTAVLKNRAISWATYSNTPREALDFAMVNAGATVANDIQAYSRVAGEYLNDVTAWANGMDVSENGGAGFAGTLAGSRALNTLRFDTMADSVVNLGSNTLSLIGDGIAGGILVSSNTGAANKTITGGTLTAFSKTGYSGTTTNGSNVITNVSSIADLTVGMPITGNNIPANAYITAISGTSITISANATASGTSPNLATTTPEVVIHQYGKGVLTVNSTVTGNGILTIAGPSVTTPETYGTTGTVRLTNTGNNYTGSTNISGAVLEISQTSVLGLNPAGTVNDPYNVGKVVMNGGALRWTGEVGFLGNRGITFNGNGGLIDVANATGNLVIGSLANTTNGASSLASQELFRGDLIKMGAGTLTLMGNSGSFSGLMDIRQGSLVIMADVAGNNNVGTTTVLGSNRSWADGTILRQGTNIQAFLGNGNNGGDWNIEEFMTFEGNNTFTYGGLLDIVPTSPLTSLHEALDGQFNLSSRRPLNMNGVLDIKGTTTFDIMINSTMRLNNGSGYLTGSGDIIKDGQGQLQFRANVPDWKGNLVIKQGVVYAVNQADVLGTGYASGKTITLGDAERGGTADLLIQNPDNVQAWSFDINHNINVVYNPGQTKRLGIDNIANGNLVSYNGDITLNDNLILLMRDTTLAAGGEQSVVNFNGAFRDGTTTSGNITIQTDDTDTGASNQTSNRAYGYAVFNADNSGWTGDITVNTNVVYNQDNTGILRFGHQKALTAANDVTMNYNSIIQVGGYNVTIGNLTTVGGNGNFYGDAGTMSSSNYGSSEIIENASPIAATLTIAQSTPASYEASWDAFFRNGTLNSQFFAPGANILQPSAALSLTKSGNGWATLTVDNDYTGSTVVSAGILQVGRGGVGDTGAANAAGTTVLSGATIAGTGFVQGGLTILSGGTLKVGDSAGAAIGTLTVNGSAIFASGTSTLMQIRNASYNNPGALAASDPQYGFWRNGLTNDSFKSALDDLVTTAQHDMLNVVGTINWAPGSQITLSSDGYTPKAGDIIRLFKANSYTGTINVGSELRFGGETGTDLNLFNLGGNLMWDVSLFLTQGILMIVEADTALDVIEKPEIKSGPTSNRSTTVELEPGTEVLLTAVAETEGDLSKLKFSWVLNGIPVTPPSSDPLVFDKMFTEAVPGQPKQLKATYKFKANFNTKGIYHVAVSNEGGTVLSETSVAVLVDDVPEIGVQPTGATVNPGSNYTFSVTVSGISPYTYQWYKDDQPVGTPVTTASVSNSYQLTNVSEADQGSYFVRVTNEAGSHDSNPAFLKVRDRVTTAVASVNPVDAYTGQTLEFSVVHDGEANETMTYQWMKGVNPVPGANARTLTLSNVQSSDSGDYTVIVTSLVPGNSVTSNVLAVVVKPAEPSIKTPPASKTLLSGQNLPLKVIAEGSPVLSYAWKKNNAVIANAGFADISKTAALTDGGTYIVEVSNKVGTKVNKVTSAPAEIVVVDGGPAVYLPVALGAAATFNARVTAGPKTVVQYEWVRLRTRLIVTGPGPDEVLGTEDDVTTPEEYYEALPANNARFVGVKTKTLKLTSTIASDNGIYLCLVKGPDLGTGDDPVAGSATDLRLFTAPPEFQPTSPVIVNGMILFSEGIVGADYNFTVPVDRTDVTKSPDKITASGLPAGLKIDPVSGVISGKPTAATKLVTGSKVTITLANKSGKTSLTGNLIVRDIPSSVIGAWTGVVQRSSLNDGLGGRVDITVTSKATYSGKLVMGGTTYALSGPLDLTTSSAPSGSAYIKRAGTPAPAPLRVDFTLSTTDNTISNGIVTDGAVSVGFDGWRLIYSKTAPATEYAGYHTLSLALPLDGPYIPADPKNGSTIVPLGAGYATFTVALDGKLTVVGKMPDGEAVSVATFLGPDAQIGIYQYMYKALKPGGSLLGQLVIDDHADAADEEAKGTSNNTLSGTANWVRPASTKATDRLFKGGFGLPGLAVGLPSTPLNVVAIGGRYDPPTPATDRVVLDLPNPQTTANNAYVDFDYGQDLGITYNAQGLTTSDNPDADLYIAKGSKITASKDLAVNPTKTALTAAPKTGLITGSFATDDRNPRLNQTVGGKLQPPTVKRSVKFQGVIINENGTLVGVGFFTMPLLPQGISGTDPNGTMATTSPFVSGRFIFDKLP